MSVALALLMLFVKLLWQGSLKLFCYEFSEGSRLVQALANSDKRWTVHPTMEKLKRMAQDKGLWNFWISPDLASCYKSLMPSNAQVESAVLSNPVKPCCIQILR